MPSIHRPLTTAFVAAVVLAGCANSFTSDLLAKITPYKVEVVQGNVVTSEQIAQLKPGMTREQVRNALGAPLVTDAFHANRWDYLFSLRRQGAEVQRRSIVIEFDGDVLKRIEAPELPTEQAFVAGIRPAAVTTEPPKLELSDEERRALPAPKPAVAAAAAASAPEGAKRSYPPLEPAR